MRNICLLFYNILEIKTFDTRDMEELKMSVKNRPFTKRSFA